MANPESDHPAFKDAVLALPYNPPVSANVPDVLYASALAFVKSHHKRTITKLKKAALLSYLPDELIDSSLYDNAMPHWLRLRLTAIRDDARKQELLGSAFDDLNELLAKSATNSGANPARWNPCHLVFDTLGPSCPNWHLYHEWKVWEGQKMSLEGRTREFIRGSIEGRNVDAFIKRLIYLGLPVPKWSPRETRGDWKSWPP